MRLKPHYTKTLLIIDIVLCLLTGFAWLVVMIPRELYRLNKAR